MPLAPRVQLAAEPAGSGAESACILPSPPPYPTPGSRARLLLPLAYIAMGVCYFLALRSPTNGFWYPPIAFGKLLLLVYGPKALLAVLASELTLMGVQYALIADVGFLAAGLVSLATTTEALLAWWLLRRWPVDASFRRSEDLLRLLVFGGLVPNLAGALLGLSLLNTFVTYSPEQVAPRALLWAFGDFVTTITWMPAFVYWLAPLLCGRRLPQAWPPGKLLELAFILLASAATCVYVALGMLRRPDLLEYNLKFLCFLPLIWAGIRFGLAGATASLAIASTTWAMLYGNARPLTITDLAITIEQVQVFNLALGVGGLVIGWAIDAERRARDMARRLSAELQARQASLHEAFAAVAAAQDRATRAGEIKYRLLSAVSHELRTPLTPMTLLLSELTDRADLPPEVHESAEMVMRQVEIEAAIVEELLEYADLMSGGEMRFCDTTWKRILASLEPAVTREASDAGVRLTWDTPEGDSPLWADERKLARAMLHTIRHAVRASRPDAEVSLTAGFEDGALRLVCRVAAIRPGFSFTQVDPFTATDQKLNGNHSGLGLALATARLILQYHNGSLRVSVSPGDHSATYTLLVRCPQQLQPAHPPLTCPPCPDIVV